MNITQAVKSRSHRTLSHLQSFRDVGLLTDQATKSLQGIAFQGDEALIGVYENNPGKLDELIAVTTRGLRIHQAGDWRFYPFEVIDEVTVTSEAGKREADALALTLSGGQQVILPIRGGDERFRDVWEFSRFLARTISLPDAS